MMFNSHDWQAKVLIPISDAEALKAFIEGGLEAQEVQGRENLIEAMYCGRCGLEHNADTETTECGITPEKPTP
jgi:hypothetical protein